MVRVDFPADRRAGHLAVVLQSRRAVGSGLLTVLAVAVLGTAAGGPEWIRSWLIASVLVAFVGVLIVGRYWAAETVDRDPPSLVAARLVLCVGLLGVLYQSRTPGYGLGVHRGIETAAVFVALVAFCVLAGDPRRYDLFQWLVLGCFAVVAGIFFYHSVSIAEVSVRSRHPVWWGVTAGVCLTVLPQYVSREAFLWAVSRLVAALVVVTLPIYVLGEYSLLGLQFTFHEGYTIPLLEYEVRATRSLFVNRNSFATMIFAGLVAALAECYRAVEADRSSTALVMPGVLLVANTLGFAVAYGRALLVLTPIVLGIYLAYLVIGRRAVPVAIGVGFLYLTTGIVAVHSGVLPLPEGTPTRMSRWYPSLAAILDTPSLLGEGLIAPGHFVADYRPSGSTGSPHNSYLSIWIRTGIVGGIAYIGLVVVSLGRGLWLSRDVDVDVVVLALAVGYAAHQQFEAYTMFQTFSSSIVVALTFGMLVFGGRTASSAVRK